MINENILVTCDNLNERDCVFDFLKLIGFERSCGHENHESVCIDFESKEFYDFSKDWGVSEGREIYTYQQFMEKYAMSDLQKKVEEVKGKLGLSNKELSLKLGHNPRYITNAILDKSPKRHADIIIKLEAFLLKESGELTHDFEGNALHKHIDDAIMVGKDEYESMKKEIDHKTQVAEKHSDMRAKAEAEAKAAIEKMLLAEQDSEKWQGDFWTVSRENIELTNSKRAISICLAVSILIIVVMLAFGVLHFNGVV